MSAIEVDAARLDDLEVLAANDPGEMLRHIASGAAQVREAQVLAAEAEVERIADLGRPRAVLVAGMGGSAITGDVVATVCGPGCPVQVVTVRGYHLPAWAGAADLVIAVSHSGTTEETLSLAAEAVRRGCRLMCVGAGGSPLADIAARGGAPFVPVPAVPQPRAGLWGMVVPSLLAIRALGLTEISDELLEATARRLEDMSHRCRPASDAFVNPGKVTALEIAGSLPMIWGTSPLAGVVARRFACQLAENAKYPAIHGELPEASHNQVVAFDGVFAGAGADHDLFRDRIEESEGIRLHLVIVRDSHEHPRIARRRELSAELAAGRGVRVTELAAEGEHPLERLAGLIAHVDYVSAYLALAIGEDPSPVTGIDWLKTRIS